MATTNDLFAQAIKETKHLHCSEVLLVRDLFKGYEWNRISRRDRLYLETLFLNYIYTFGTHLEPIENLLLDSKNIKSKSFDDFICFYNDNFSRGRTICMKAELYKRLFRAIFSEDVLSLKKIAITIIQEERKLGHNVLADSLEKISITEKPKYTLFESKKSDSGLSSLPKSKRTNSQLVSYIPREQLKHHMILPNEVEERLLSIEQEYVARERLKKFNLLPKRKILLYGPPGCGKTLSAERIAWNLGLPLLKVRFDSLLSSYFGESASNLRMVFDYCKSEPVVLLLDECDFIAKSRTTTQDVGEVPRIVNMLLTLLDEYDAPGLVLATTNLKVSLDKALFRRFDDVIEMPMPKKSERTRLLEMTLSAIPISPDVNLEKISDQLDGYSAANIVLIAQRAAKICILAGHKKVCNEHFVKALEESSKF